MAACVVWFKVSKSVYEWLGIEEFRSKVSVTVERERDALVWVYIVDGKGE